VRRPARRNEADDHGHGAREPGHGDNEPGHALVMQSLLDCCVRLL
jgi:hypothetical protein